MFKIERIRGESINLAGHLLSPVDSVENRLLNYKVSYTSSKGRVYEQRFIGRFSKDNKPLIVWFHGWHAETSFYDLHPEHLGRFNIVFPQDRNGYNRSGSWWLGGSSPEDWHYPLLTKYFISHLQSNGLASDLIFCGSSMGGFGALMNACFYENVKCFVSVPQTTLNPAGPYFKGDKQKILSKIGIHASGYEAQKAQYPILDLRQPINRNMPIRFCDKELEFRSQPRFVHITTTIRDIPGKAELVNPYLNYYILPYISNISSLGSNASVNILPISGHDCYFMPSSVINYYSKYLSKQQLDLNKGCSFQWLGMNDLFANTLRLDL